MDEMLDLEHPEETIERLQIFLIAEWSALMIFAVGIIILSYAAFIVGKLKSLPGNWAIFLCLAASLVLMVIDPLLEYYLEYETYFFVEAAINISLSLLFLVASIYTVKYAKVLRAKC